MALLGQDNGALCAGIQTGLIPSIGTADSTRQLASGQRYCYINKDRCDAGALKGWSNMYPCISIHVDTA